MITYCRPKIKKLNSKEAQVLIPLKRRTKNHFNSMYFGALSIGADFTAGLLVVHLLKKHNSKAKLLFKDFNANFIKRANSNVLFLCSDNELIETSILENLKSKKRVNFKVKVEAVCTDGGEQFKIANFFLTTSIK